MNTTLPPPAAEPTEAEIQHAAYLLWVENGRPEGREVEHWHAARSLLLPHHGRRSNPAPKSRRIIARATVTSKK